MIVADLPGAVGAQLEVGPNLLQLGLGVVQLTTLFVTLKLARKATAAHDAATSAAAHASATKAELSRNGGSTALDKIEAGQSALWQALEDIRRDQLASAAAPPATITRPE